MKTISQWRRVAVFGEVSWFVTSALELTVGARYTHESKDLKRKACQAFGALGMVLPGIDDCNPAAGAANPFALNIDLDEDFSKVTPKVGISYNFSEAGLGLFHLFPRVQERRGLMVVSDTMALVMTAQLPPRRCRMILKLQTPLKSAGNRVLRTGNCVSAPLHSTMTTRTCN